MAKKQHPRKAHKITPEAKNQLVERIKGGDNIKLTVDVNEVSKMTAGELRLLCFDNESHPKAKDFLKAVEEMPDDMEVNVCKVDVLAVAENYEVVESRSVTGGIEERVKRKGPSRNDNPISSDRLSTFGETDQPFEPDSLANVRPADGEDYGPLAPLDEGST